MVNKLLLHNDINKEKIINKKTIEFIKKVNNDNEFLDKNNKEQVNIAKKFIFG